CGWRPRVDIGFFDSQIPEPAPPEGRGRSARTALAVSYQVLGNRIIRPNHLFCKRVPPEAFLLHLADHLVHTVIGRPFPSALAHEGGCKVKVPVTAFAFLHPGGGCHGNPLLGKPVDKSLPFLKLHVYQRGFSHESTPCLLSVMAS